MPALRPVHYKDLIRVFEQDGFIYNRTEGDHSIYTKEGVRRPVVIPLYRAVPVFIIKNLLRTAGMSRDRYFALLTRSE
jgi:predicted RNA binding protein YcfA (HicA-like mRNA interferase family)